MKTLLQVKKKPQQLVLNKGMKNWHGWSHRFKKGKKLFFCVSGLKNIFKKYGWTLQGLAVVLSAGLVLGAVALAAMNGLKAGTKAIGNGLKVVGKKLGSLLPGLIGSIVSFIFRSAGQVLSFLGEHAWLLILAVVAFLMERLLKKTRR